MHHPKTKRPMAPEGHLAGQAGPRRQIFLGKLAALGLAMAMLGTAPVLQVAALGSMGSGDGKPAKERETMTGERLKSTRPVAIPPLDASQPAKTETATFALG